MPLTPEQEQEIAAERDASRPTRRATVPALEEILYEALPVLDHGFVRVVDYMGDDGAIVQAARVSYGRGTRRVSEDQGLINYLMRHRHTTPFEMCEIKYHVKLPIFVARQWIRHRTANVNEYSARYSILDNEFYIPAPEHLAAQASVNRQGRGDVIEGAAAQRVLDLLRGDAERAYAGYTTMLNEDATGAPTDPAWPGLARELARMNLSLNFYTQWYWKTDLHNLLHFLSLRADPHAQYEIRAYAEVMLETVRRWVPMTYDAFLEYRMNAATISATGLAIIRRMLTGEAVEQAESGLSAREWRELMAVITKPASSAEEQRTSILADIPAGADPGLWDHAVKALQTMAAFLPEASVVGVYSQMSGDKQLVGLRLCRPGGPADTIWRAATDDLLWGDEAAFFMGTAEHIGKLPKPGEG